MKRFKKYMVYDKPHSAVLGGKQKLYRFKNNYGASVIKFLLNDGEELPVGSYGAKDNLWELAVIRYKSKAYELDYTLGMADSTEWSIVYNTPIEGVIGYLTPTSVGNYLKQIKDLEDEDVRED